MWFYWVNVVDTLVVILIVLLNLAVVACVISGIIAFTTLEYGDDDEDHKAAKRIFKRCFITAVVVAIAVILIPTKNTLIEMQIARYATYENAEITIDAIKSAVDYIVDAMKSVK
jgi:Na+-driven multidrug efflux pump